MRYKDLTMLENDSFYPIAEELLEEPEITFIFAGVKEYFDEILEKREQLNISDDDLIELFKILINKSNDFFQEFLFDHETFEKLDIKEQYDLIYKFLKKDLPKWVYEETGYEDNNYSDDFNTPREPYDVSKIDIINNTYQASYLYTRFKYAELILSPDYQRNFVWTAKQKSRLIESILINIPLPIFYIDARNEDKWIVIDGLQRLTSIFKFMDNEFKLTNLEYLKNLNGKKFKDLDRKFQRRIDECQLLCNRIRPNTPPEIAFNIFQRINTLGSKLEIQEIRNAMYLGKSTDLLTLLSEKEEFQLIIDKNKGLSKRKDDQAIILRYLAFKISRYKKYQSNNMNNFLSNAMNEINSMNELEIKSLENDFVDCMKKGYEIFGKNAFRKSPKGDKQSPISKSLFETIGYCLDKYTLEELKERKIQIVNHVKVLYEDEEFILKTSIATNNPPNVHYRFEKFEELFKNILGK